MQVVLPTSHRRSQARKTPVSFAALARSAWRRPSSRDLIFTPLPFSRVLMAWLGIEVSIRLTDLVGEAILMPLFGRSVGEVLGAVLSIACVLAITRTLFRSYTEQWAGALVWYGVVLAGLTVLCEILFASYVQQQFGYEILARYNVLRGELWTFVVITIGLTPLLWTRWSAS